MLGIEAVVGDGEVVGAGLEVAQAEGAVAIGERDLVGAFDLHLGLVQELPRVGVGDGADNRGGAGRLGGESGRDERQVDNENKQRRKESVEDAEQRRRKATQW